jgi:colanic acid/amylovoran biosynthesis glycosyltransferase
MVMLSVAYLANLLPSAVEPYVIEEIEELRRRGVRVIAGSVRKPSTDQVSAIRCPPEIVLQPLTTMVLLRALWLCLRRWRRIAPLLTRVLFRGREGPGKRVKALAHTGLGGCYAVLLQGHGVDHIHVHHGYFGSWIAMVAARLLDVGFSVTLHGSDLLLHGTYLDVKLESCTLCLTVSEYNRRYILRRYPAVAEEKVVVARLGVDVPDGVDVRVKTKGDRFTLLAVGRLHAVKDHAFLVRACAQLRKRNLHFECSIAGEGPERSNLESLIRKCDLEKHVSLLGYVARDDMNALYDRADVVVLTSRSEGIPLVLMEAMARGKIVLAPAITGIPELVIDDKTGFLYEPGSLSEFVERLEFIRSLMIHPRMIRPPMIRSRMRAQSDPEHRSPLFSATRKLDWVRYAARVQVRNNFNRSRNLDSFGDMLLQRIAPPTESIPHEDFVLQQI